jgi:hypothetical protein
VRSWRGIARGSAIVVGLTLAAAAALDCYGHQCDANHGLFPPEGGDAGRGRMLDDNTYETNAIDEPWLNYPGNVRLDVSYPKDMGRPMAWLEPYVGTSQQPSQTDSATWILASGALAEIVSSNSTDFSVLNATCASYYARFVVHFAPRPAIDGGLDAPQDSTTLDSGTDAGVD